jgi:predicted esterase
MAVLAALGATATAAASSSAPAAAAVPGAGASSPVVPAPGAVAERVACAGDPEETYALYLPPAYDPGRTWPILFVMDPRGRGLVGLEKFRAGAGRLGWVVASSWNTESDGPPGPNVRALNAFLADARQRLAVDRRRFYLAGFSGTARAAWDFADRLRDTVAGIAGFGAGLPPGVEPPVDAPWVFFGGAGFADFNYEEVLTLGPRLDRAGIHRHVTFYDGPHAWPPDDVAAAALDWMENQAMRQGLRPRDEARLDGLREAGIARARDLETRGRTYAAFLCYRDLAADIEGLGDPSAAAAAAARLGRSGAVRRVLADQQRMLDRRREYEGRFGSWLQMVRGAGPPPSLDRSLALLKIGALQREAAAGEAAAEAASAGEDAPGHGGATATRQAARRLLEWVLAQTAFYQPEDLLAQGRPDRALAVLEVAAAVKPGQPAIEARIQALRQQTHQGAAPDL